MRYNYFKHYKFNHTKFAIGLLSISSYFYINYKKTSLQSCGIIGYIGQKDQAVQACVNGIQILQFRGYDSCGVCTYNKDKKDYDITKYSSITPYYSNEKSDDCIVKITNEVPKKHLKSTVGIGHTRWATHGRKIDINAHPHIDFSGKIALVHNGIISNYKVLKEYLEKKENVILKTETDTEVVVQLIGLLYSKGKGFKESVKEVLENHIEGTYAFLIMNKDEPNKILAARSGSPLLVGVGSDFYIISSDSYAFQKYTSNYFMIESSEILELDTTISHKNTKLIKAIYEEVHSFPAKGFNHFLIQEIYEQPETIRRATNYGGRFKEIKSNYSQVNLGGLEQYKEFFYNLKNLIIIATGTSYYASLFVSNIFRRMNIFDTVQVIDACEFDEHFIPKVNPLAIFVSQSGESKDVLVAFEIVKEKGVICLGVVNKIESTLSREVTCGVFINAGREISVASTKAFSASFYNYLYTYSIKFIKSIPNTLEENLDYFSEKSKYIAEKIYHHNSLFVLGRGFAESIAKEISLKIKEVTYIHAEGYNALSFKHGPLAMIDSDLRTPVIIIADKNDHFEDIKNVLEIVKNKNATIILLTNAKELLCIDNIDFIVNIPDNGFFSSFYSIIIGQLLSYYICINKGYNPDKPRHLSKEVTV